MLSRRALAHLVAGATVGLMSGTGVAAQSLPMPPEARRRQVFAHWNFFPTSFDNKPEMADYYTLQLLAPKGEGGKWLAVGGMLRERPMPRPPRNTPTWMVDDCRAELLDMAAIGIDAVHVNILTLLRNHQLWKNIENLIAAASSEPRAARVIPCFDCVTLNNPLPSVDDLVALYRWFDTQSGLYRTEKGELLISAFMAERWDAGRWAAILAGIRRAGIEVAFFPVFLDVDDASDAQIALASQVGEWSGNTLGSLSLLPAAATRIRRLGPSWCSPVWPQDFRPKDLWLTEAENTRLFRDGWAMAETVQSEAVLIMTWNDYSEHSEIRPSTGISNAFYVLAEWFIHRFKTGTDKDIECDTLIYVHRAQSGNGPEYRRKQPKPVEVRLNSRLANDVEVVTLLKAPATVEIEVAGRITVSEAPAGLSAHRATLDVGRPRFRVTREGEIIGDVQSRILVADGSDYEDFLYRAGVERLC